MKKIIRLTESQLINVVKRVIKEQVDPNWDWLQFSKDRSPIRNSIARLKFEGFQEKPVIRIETADKVNRSENKIDVVIRDKSRQFMEFLSKILTVSLNDILRKDGQKLVDEFNPINTEFRRILGEFLDSVGFQGQYDSPNDIQNFLNNVVSRMNEQRRQDFLVNLRSYVTKIRTFNQSLLNRKITGFPIDLFKFEGQNINPTDSLGVVLDIGIEKSTGENKVKYTDFLNMVGKEYIANINQQAAGGADPIVFKNIDDFVSRSPNLSKAYKLLKSDLSPTPPKLNLKSLQVIVYTATPNIQRIV